MGSACTACCDPVQKKDAECDLSSRKLPHTQPLGLPTPVEAEIRRHASRDSVRDGFKRGASKQESSPKQIDKHAVAVQSNLKISSSQIVAGLTASPPRVAYDGSNPDLLKGKGTMGADVSNVKSAVQNSKLSDPPFNTNNMSSNPKMETYSPMESPVINRAVIDKPHDRVERAQEQENSSEMKSSVTNNVLELPGPIGTDQKNYIVVMRADQTKKPPSNRTYQKSPSDCKSIEKGFDDALTPHGVSIYLMGQPAHLMPSRSAITVAEDGGTVVQSSKPRDPQGYLFSQETAHNKLDNSILKSRYDLANYPSGRTIDVPDEGKTKEILKILSYDQLTDIKVFTEKRYQKTLVQL